MGSTTRLNVTLSAGHAAKLARLAERAHVQAGTIASSLLAQSLDEADPDAQTIVEILDAIPGAFEQIEQSRRDIENGAVVDLQNLA